MRLWGFSMRFLAIGVNHLPICPELRHPIIPLHGILNEIIRSCWPHLAVIFTFARPWTHSRLVTQTDPEQPINEVLTEIRARWSTYPHTFAAFFRRAIYLRCEPEKSINQSIAVVALRTRYQAKLFIHQFCWFSTHLLGSTQWVTRRGLIIAWLFKKNIWRIFEWKFASILLWWCGPPSSEGWAPLTFWKVILFVLL